MLWPAKELTTAGQDQGLRGVDGNAAYVVRMSLKGVRLVQRVVVVDTDLHVIGPGDEPILASHKASGSHRYIADLKVLDQLLVLVVHDVYVAIVQGAEHPRLRGVNVYAFHAIRARGEASLYVQFKWHL